MQRLRALASCISFPGWYLDGDIIYRENRGEGLKFLIKSFIWGEEYTLLNRIPYMVGNRASTQGHDVISTHYIISTRGSYKRG